MVRERELKIAQGLFAMGVSRGRTGSAGRVRGAPLVLVSFLVASVGAYPPGTRARRHARVLAPRPRSSSLGFFLSRLFASANVAAVASSLLYVLTWVPAASAVAANPEGSDAAAVASRGPRGRCTSGGGPPPSRKRPTRRDVGEPTPKLFDGGDGEFTGAESGTFGTGRALAVAGTSRYAALAPRGESPREGGGGAAIRGFVVFFVRGARACAAFDRPDLRSRSRPGIAWTLVSRHSGDDATSSFARTAVLPEDLAILPRGVEPEAGDDAYDGCASSSEKTGGGCAPPRRKRAAAIRAEDLVKTFDGGRVAAVDGLRFVAREGEVTALLGHNGAGKTTLVSILTGALAPDSGRVFVGSDFSDPTNSETPPRRPASSPASLGVCPQFDVLWPTLTVREHLAFFANLRGIPRERVSSECASKLAAAGLRRLSERRAGELSGGQRRKLSVAVAFVGDPRVVILDEPTTGMDPKSRRRAWRMIREYVRGEGASVLFTTHFMDEADELADRVMIQTAGKLACVGSPLFLKTAFGRGDRLLVELEEEEEEEESAREDERGIEEGSGNARTRPTKDTTCPRRRLRRRREDNNFPRVANVLEAVRRRVPGASAERSSALASAASATSASFALPATGAAFPAALRRRGRGGQSAGRRLSASRSTLEEVFHDVGARVAKLLDEGREGDAEGTTRKGRGGREKTVETEETSPEETSPEETSPSSSSSSSSKKPATALRRDPPGGPSATPRASRATRRTVRSGRFAQFSACLFKRAAHVRRDARGFCVSALVPVLFVVAGALAASVPAARAGIRPSRRWTELSGGAAIGLPSSPDDAASPRPPPPPAPQPPESSPVVDRCDADEDAGGRRRRRVRRARGDARRRRSRRGQAEDDL